MITIINTKLGENRGVPRIWLEGSKLEHAFMPGDKIDVTIDPDKKQVSVNCSSNGKYSVSKRNRNGKCWPLIELRNAAFRDIFNNDMMLRVVVKKGVVLIEAHGDNLKVIKRVKQFITKIKNNVPLSIASLFSGGGVLDRAISDGLHHAGIESYTKFAVEIESKYLNAMIANQPQLFKDDSILIESAIEFVELRKPPLIDFLIAGIPCTGASRAGKSKNKIKEAEFHNSAGACFYYALQFISACRPLYILLENVSEYIKSTSMAVIRSVLSTLGYELSESVLNGVEFGTLENRDRMCLVASLKGVPKFQLDKVKPIKQKPQNLSSVLEDIPLEAKCWREYQHLAEKEKRDLEAGKGFKRAMYDGSEESVSTIRRLYNKAGSCDQYLIHRSEKKLSRLFTPIEHARIKGIPEDIIKGVSTTTAHEILGQSICFPVFEAVGVSLGGCFKRSIA